MKFSVTVSFLVKERSTGLIDHLNIRHCAVTSFRNHEAPSHPLPPHNPQPCVSWISNVALFSDNSMIF